MRWPHTAHLSVSVRFPGEAEIHLLVTPSSARKMPFKGLSVLSENEELVLKNMIIENAKSLYEVGMALISLRSIW